MPRRLVTALAGLAAAGAALACAHATPAHGSPPPFTVATDPAGADVDLAGDGRGGALAVWRSGADVKSRAVGGGEAPAVLARRAAWPSVAHGGDGRYVVAYVTAAGVEVDGRVIIGGADKPDIAATRDGFLVAARTPEPQAGIAVARLDDAGRPLGGPVAVASAPTGDDPAIAADPATGTALVVWTDRSGRVQAGSPVREVFARPLGADGAPTGPARQLTRSPDADVRDPGVAFELGVRRPSLAWNARAGRYVLGYALIVYTPARERDFEPKLGFDSVTSQLEADLSGVDAPVAFFGSSYALEPDAFTTDTAVDPATGVSVTVMDGQPFGSSALRADGSAGRQDAILVPEPRRGGAVAAVGPGAPGPVLAAAFATDGRLRARYFDPRRPIDSDAPRVVSLRPRHASRPIPVGRVELVLRCDEACAVHWRAAGTCRRFRTLCLDSRDLRTVSVVKRSSTTYVATVRMTRGARTGMTAGRKSRPCISAAFDLADAEGNSRTYFERDACFTTRRSAR